MVDTSVKWTVLNPPKRNTRLLAEPRPNPTTKQIRSDFLCRVTLNDLLGDRGYGPYEPHKHQEGYEQKSRARKVERPEPKKLEHDLSFDK
jgi:hypothetical protein